MKQLSKVGIIGNNLIDADVEMGRLPPGTKDRRAWVVEAHNARKTAKNLSAWLQSHGVKATVLMDMPKGKNCFKLGVELSE